MSDSLRPVLVTSVDVRLGSEAAFNTWYNDIHLPEILACPGFISCTRYESVVGEPRYLAIYQLDTEDALTTPEMARVRGWGEQFPNVRNFHERIYRPIWP